MEKTEQFEKAKEINPGDKSPGPQKYWKSPKFKFINGKSQPIEIQDTLETDQNGNEVKQYIMKREKTDKRIYKPMKSYIF